MVMTACGSDSTDEAALTGTNWEVSWFGPVDQPSPLVDETRITMTFDSATKVVSGRSGCASFSASYVLHATGQISVDNLVVNADADCNQKAAAAVTQLKAVAQLFSKVNQWKQLPGDGLVFEDQRNGIKLSSALD